MAEVFQLLSFCSEIVSGNGKYQLSHGGMLDRDTDKDRV